MLLLAKATAGCAMFTPLDCDVVFNRQSVDASVVWRRQTSRPPGSTEDTGIHLVTIWFCRWLGWGNFRPAAVSP